SGITTLDDGKIYLGNASNVATEVTPTGDVTITNAGVTAIGTGKVVTTMLATDAVTTTKITNGNVTTAKLADDAVETAKIKNANVTNAKLATGIDATKLADGSVTNTELQYIGTLASDAQTQIDALSTAGTTNTTAITAINTLDNGKIYLGNASNVATEVTPTGDVTITNAGVTAIGTGKVITAMLADDAVTTIKITNANVTNAKLATGIDATKLADGSVTNTELQYIGTLASDAQTQIDALSTAGTTNTTAITAINTLDNGKIYLGNASNVATEVTPTGDVTITNAGVTAIGTGKVITAMLADDAVTTAKITNANVTTAKLADDAVETAKIKNANVTYAKIQNVSATDKVLGRVSSGAGVIEEIATTGSGDVVRATSPTLVTPVIGAATGTSLSVTGQLTSTVATGTAPLVVTSTTPVTNLNIGGNAATATKLATARKINTVDFDGTADITVTAAAGTLTGNTLASNVVSSSLTSVGTIATGTWNGTTIAIANGGTGQTTKTAAFDALSPMTTAGDIIYGGTSGSGTRLAKGTDGQVLVLAAGVPKWSNNIGGDVLSKTDSYDILATDSANLLVYSGSATSKTIKLPSAVTVGAGREITIKNIASVSVSIAAVAGNLISDSTTTGATTLSIGVEPSNNWIKAISDGTNWIILRALF
ncbi:MAG: hypothetical protein KA468_07540, partial [Flavobacterium sp.]